MRLRRFRRNEPQAQGQQSPQPNLLNKILNRANRAGPDQSESPPGDMPAFRAKGQKVIPEELRELRELIRHRYALDIEIWTLRNVRPRDRPVVEEKMRRADAALKKIRRIVLSLDSQEFFTSPKDYSKFQEIKSRIMADGKRNWTQHPPWEENQ